jgi:hypothetical protein
VETATHIPAIGGVSVSSCLNVYTGSSEASPFNLFLINGQLSTVCQQFGTDCSSLHGVVSCI